ncbi:SubName: Full=Uncharacterized protein {ECO:0000313/EMBL:CCA71003.1} [Serendipita indica DSM 11827]|uniref:Large ribosomal subunit protein uL29m n=1 Tax=Serendipita indica (strain DSM 11827) TaxID=1109443 RepID=G4TI54_SERID|nr:SubName: Full=Uncharacterized protein {ECO:0000313/EMBL:CCA71003.1} [Serendipita indica DSM 11827]CCA71003.1 hypothetical protein PIIN_04936 [Serendipita indica DSM 11827]
MFRLRPATRTTLYRQTRPVILPRRLLATHAEEGVSLSGRANRPEPADDSESSKVQTKPGALREHLGIDVNPNHGLYHFFRKVEDEDQLHGFKYVLFEGLNDLVHGGSRSWTTAELRRKSFRDLHIIWYMCRREINLLATQRAEVRRLHHLASYASTPISKRARMCRKTCARIKFVLNERRLAYLDADTRIQWKHRPGYKDPKKKPPTKLVRGPKMTKSDIYEKMKKLGAKQKLKHIHPELRKRPMLMLRWAGRRGAAKPITFESDIPGERDA